MMSADCNFGKHILNIFKDLKKVVWVKDASFSTIRRWHCEFKTRKSGNNTDKPNGSPKNALNKSNVAAVATLMKGDPHNYI